MGANKFQKKSSPDGKFRFLTFLYKGGLKALIEEKNSRSGLVGNGSKWFGWPGVSNLELHPERRTSNFEQSEGWDEALWAHEPAAKPNEIETMNPQLNLVTLESGK